MTINRIHRAGNFRYEEAVANAALSPGHLIQLRSDGKVEKHSVAGARAERYFAIEDALQAYTGVGSPSHTVNDAYAASDLVPGILCERGTEINAMLKGGINYVVGVKLVSAGDGTLEPEANLASAGLEKDCIAVNLKALDLSASAGVPAALNPVRII